MSKKMDNKKIPARPRKSTLSGAGGERSKKRGFTLLMATLTTSMLLLISFVVVNIAVKQLLLANAAEESQHAFYAADSGVECAIYWDLKNPTTPGISAFATSTNGSISCNGQTISTDSQTVQNIPSEQSRIGSINPISIFQLDFLKGCVIVSVTKEVDGTTTIDSRGYNTCDTSSLRRFERGVRIQY
jgi:hypothetical protein